MPTVRPLCVLLACSLPLLVGCATQESFRVPVLRPAPVDLGQHELVAIDRFAGEGADALDAELTTALRRAVNPMTGAADFEVVHRSDVDRMIDDMRRYPGTDLDGPDSPVAKWKRAGVQLSGDVQTCGVEETDQASEWVDPKGVRRTKFVRTATATLVVTIEVRDSDGNKVFDRVRIEERASAQTKAVDQEPAAIDHEALLASARRQVVEQYLARVTPHTEHLAVHLFVDGDLPELGVGNGFARTGDWEAALRSYRTAADRANGELGEVRFKAMHNVGTALLFAGRFDDARAALQEAYAQGQEGATLRQLELVAQREADAAALQRQSDRGLAAPGR